ncbi:Uncharacterised protein [Mycobacteroides abscessus subsp. bolletii]|uniref:Lipoprotein n=1 Tax=Mycobacteroides abscessus subsp. bolletii TaxID=319705 RepID=A0A9Q7WII4_9MYCO|nr:hypothetical protein [Mycobacteroides abscessus]MBN7391523.1 hypothetical protein [Mycobacteroides abscessus subsp. abscessus]SHU23557.1 Uncharacterised protein [Mycobacteroides abscessus subsp. bolletii]SHV18435.1 Uncharacterised protein [Mycobacteroides abscessus subsp. bolletii]SHX23363.1 Uncharacterised protein [Mycobacteroides abscessus subsp. bolletii]SHY61795.1 Uncharacterised protein [Mycobacteroides abscessus subsp. bolletii]
MIKPVLGAILLSASFIAGCQTHSEVTELTPVATTTVADSQGVVPRFNNDIWPAMEGYRAPGQGSPANRRFVAILDKELTPDEFSAVRAANEGLGKVWRNKDNELEGIASFPTGDLTLADTSLTALDSSKATLQICYTYVAGSYGATINDPLIEKPAASEATVELRKTDNWYLYSITDDHVVPECPASPKA